MCLFRDQLLAQNFDAVLAVIVKLSGDLVVAKFCQDALYHILRHPRSIHIAGLHWGLGTRVGWRWRGDVIQMGGDGMEDRQWGAGNDICDQDWRLKVLFFTFRLHYGSILGVFAWILGASGLRLGLDWVQWFRIGVLGVTSGVSRLHFGWA